METPYSLLHQGLHEQVGWLIGQAITPVPPPNDPYRIIAFYRSSDAFRIQSDAREAITHNSPARLSKKEGNAWVEIFVAYWQAVGDLLAAEEAIAQNKQAGWGKVYQSWKGVVNALIRGYNTADFPAWSVPCLYVAGKFLRIFAIKADEETANTKGDITFNAGFEDDIVGAVGKNDNLEDAARLASRIWQLCYADRAPLEESKKWGLYYLTNLLFRIYFRLKSINLCKNLIRSLHASSADMPPLTAFPAPQRVTYQYYVGVIHFLEEDYAKAEEHLTEAWRECHKESHQNRELILTYLIPCHLLTTRTLPTTQLLAPYPRLQRLFSPLAVCIKRGDIAGFHRALEDGWAEFVKRRIYLTLERGQDIAMRNLFRKIFILGGYDPLKEGQTEKDRIRRTRIPLREFAAALNFSMKKRDGEELENEAVECFISNLIYKNLMKGYIHQDSRTVVLSKTNAFPGTGV